ncbi:MAG: 30S ribosomal protein S6 [Eubacteriaceae bacterium]|jgi:small subunit ribosomal protein S6
MKSYETLVVLQPELTKEQIDDVLAKITAIINADGEVETVEEWGKRKLAYEIDKKYTEGYYVLINFKATTAVLPNLDHLYKINDEFIRSLVINKEK